MYSEKSVASFHLDCDCHHPLHFLKFEVWEWDGGGEYDSIDVYFCASRVGGFWKRLKRAWPYIFGTQNIITADITMTTQQARELAGFLQEVADGKSV